MVIFHFKKLLLFLFVLVSTAGFSQTTDLFITEYAEGSSSHKYLELYNGTGASINLANYELWRISNGNSTIFTFVNWGIKLESFR